MEDKEKVRERVRRYREKKKVPMGLDRFTDALMPLILALQDRVTVLEVALGSLQKNVTVVKAVTHHKDESKEGASLFKRVMEEKENRLRDSP